MTLVADFIHSQSAPDEFAACEFAVNRHFGDFVSATTCVDLIGAAKAKGIAIQWRSGLPYEGMIERAEDGGASISLRSGMNRRRERFTLAHELGHWLLQEEMLGTCEGKLFRGLSRNRTELQDEERLANLIAAEILLPRRAVLATFEQTEHLSSLEELCRGFAVSRMMAVRRVADVTGNNLALLQIMPYQFSNLDSAAQIDDAVFATSRKATRFDRKRTKLVGGIRFGSLANGGHHSLTVDSPRGVIREDFQMAFRPTPVPHVFALAVVDQWPCDRQSTSASAL